MAIHLMITYLTGHAAQSAVLNVLYIDDSKDLGIDVAAGRKKASLSNISAWM